MLTFDSLIRKGYLHDHAIPPLSTDGLADRLADLPTTPFDPAQDIWKEPTHSRCVRHSIPKRGHSRRTLSLPNPQHQIPLCIKLSEKWGEIEAHCAKSLLSLSTPTIRENSPRAVGPSAYFRDISSERMVRSAGCRFHLYTDFARFYSSIYTHTVGWALHGQDSARADERSCYLSGNQIDRFVRATQDRQSVGIPVGPDSSLIIAEIVAASIDQDIQASGVTQGLRYIDDFHLYFRSRGECERAISTVHAACSKYELDINDTKTLIEPVPDVSEPPWKINLHTYPFGTVRSVDADVLSYFNFAFQLSKKHPDAGVLRYAVSRSAGVNTNDSKLYTSLLCRCAIAEPTCLPDVLRILEGHRLTVQLFPDCLRTTLEEICRYHAPLHHGYEVAWALWGAVQFRLRISDEVATLISSVEDDSVALVSLHAKELNLLNPNPDLAWRSWLAMEHLNLEHWLAAYEMAVKGWLTPTSGVDYIREHKFFSRLRELGVSFYKC